MIIINKKKDKIINISAVNEIFKGADGLSIKINFSNGTGTQIDRYNSIENADVALEMLCDAIGKNDKFNMPTDEQINTKIISKNQNDYHGFNGKKSKSHGGS